MNLKIKCNNCEELINLALDKEQYVKILRSQLSNPELYVLLFNVHSRFGKIWKEHKYVTTYTLFDNMPEGYCEGYEPKAIFC